MQTSYVEFIATESDLERLQNLGFCTFSGRIPKDNRPLTYYSEEDVNLSDEEYEQQFCGPHNFKKP